MWVKGCVIEIVFYRNLNLKAEIREFGHPVWAILWKLYLVSDMFSINSVDISFIHKDSISKLKQFKIYLL